MKIYTVRPANPEDSEKIGFVHHEAWQQTYTGLLPQEYLDKRTPQKSAAMFRASECRNIVVAESDGVIVGFCGWGEFREPDKCENIGEIYGIYLLNDFKGRHLGQKMIEYALEQLKMSGYKKIGLWVLEGNKNAIVFYEKQGFSYSGVSKTVNLGEPVTEFLYVKSV